MSDVLALVLGAAAAFVATDIDDIVVLSVLFGIARSGGTLRERQIVAGQYLGIAALVAAGVVLSLGLLFVSEEVVGLLGLIPIGLGTRGLLALRGDGENDEPPPVLAAGAGTLGVAGITIANGGDNLAVYVPYFASVEPTGLPVVMLVFAVLVGVWCLVARALGTHPVTVAAIDRWGHVAVPVVLIALGAFILLEAGTLSVPWR